MSWQARQKPMTDNMAKKLWTLANTPDGYTASRLSGKHRMAWEGLERRGYVTIQPQEGNLTLAGDITTFLWQITITDAGREAVDKWSGKEQGESQ